MCGIAGIISLDGKPIRPFDVKRMADTLVHRGPDDAGYALLDFAGSPHREMSDADFARILPDVESAGLTGGLWDDVATTHTIALGHRRLSILDLSVAGHQPMANRDRSLWIVYNGEVYNHRELRQELEAGGAPFVSRTDTEVVLRAYDAFGPACVERLSGMFAFAIVDRRRRVVFLARDRYGIKPLYWTRLGDRFLFASEIKALLAVNGVCADVEPRALVDYFTFQNTFGRTTLFEGISLLEPGHVLTVGNGSVEERRYWDFDFTPEQDRGEDNYRCELSEALGNAVERQLVADVEVGSYLSGGLDSGSITALAAQHVPRLMTFTGGFDLTNVSGFEAGFDERQDAEVLSALYGTEHYQMVFHAGDLEWALPRVVRQLEDLRVGMCYPYYYTARLASRFVKVVLAGTGGDELLAGYPWRYRTVADCRNHTAFEDRYYGYWNRLVPESQHARFFDPALLRAAGHHSPRDSFRAVSSLSRDLEDPIRKALDFEARTFLHGLLVVDDKLSMAHSLESRVPLLDDAVTEIAMRTPTGYLLNDAWSTEAIGDENLAGKYIFRRAMTHVLPEPILLKRKQGFSPPDRSWYQGPLMDYIRSVLLADRSLARGFFRPDAIRAVIGEHTGGEVNHRLLIWSLLSFEWWCRIFLDGSSDGT